MHQASNQPPHLPKASIAGRAVFTLSILWLFVAFAAYYAQRPLHLLVSWPWFSRPVWLDDFLRGWSGPPVDVIGQGLLLLWVALVAMGFGWGVFRRLQPEASHAAAVVWGGMLALAAWGMLVFFVGALGLLRHARPVFISLLVVLTLLAAWVVKAQARRMRKEGAAPDGAELEPAAMGASRARWSRQERLLLCVLAFFHAHALAYALTPCIQSDALRYHLAAPQEWLKAGRLVYLPFNAHSNFPSMIEMLFLFGLGLAGDLLATGFHFLFLPLTVGAVGLLTNEILEQSGAGTAPADDRASCRVRPALLAATVWGVSPLALPLAGWAWIDLAVTGFTLGAVHHLLRWVRTRRTGDWVLAAIFGGSLLAGKYTGFLVIGWGACMTLLFSFVRPGRETPSNDATGDDSPRWESPTLPGLLRAGGRSAAFGLIGLLIASPWLIKNLAYTGNPVYPLAHSWFGGGEWTARNTELMAEKFQEKGKRRDENNEIVPENPWAAFLRIPWTTAAHPERFGDFEMGPFYWAFSPWLGVWSLLALARIRSKPGKALVVAWGVFLLVSWFLTYQCNRFLMPGMALGTAVAVCAVVEVIRRGGRILKALCILGLGLPVLYSGVDSARWFLFNSGRWPAYTLGYLSRDDYLAANLPYYRIARYCTERLGKGERVLLVGEHRKMHWGCAVESNDWYDMPRISPFLRQAENVDGLLDALLQAGFTHLFFNLDEWGWPPDAPRQLGGIPMPSGHAWSYNQRLLGRSEILMLQELLSSKRLRVEMSARPGRIYLTRILPGSQKNDKSEQDSR